MVVSSSHLLLYFVQVFVTGYVSKQMKRGLWHIPKKATFVEYALDVRGRIESADRIEAIERSRKRGRGSR